ncbi:uncharacterized protein MEPE_00525 [Melanopsichium pennsylvanicum]|uniref:Transmembrane protein n=2 Tax=Melanopsichium pennsylvanicum TaxID=63383 RepID=A0AAJ4XGU6_9BASI|nr:uncharacterized protein MEPE_00525 [Melanopsichium pennsylvanicum]
MLPAKKLITAAVLLSSLTSSLAASSSNNSFSPSSDPGIYPGGDQNPIDGWTTLPSVVGASIDNSTLTVGDSPATLVHYIDESYNASKIKRAVIQIHGENRDAWNQWLYADLAAKRGATGGSYDRDEVVVMAPMFFNTIDEGAYAFDSTQNSANAITSTEDTAVTPTARRRSVVQTEVPFQSKRLERRGKHKIPLQKVSTTQAMIWKSVEWGDGSPVYEPTDAAGVGSFDALDAAVNFFLDRQRFPHLRNVVVAGFSLGGQLTNRYATFRNNTSEDKRIIFWISSPNSFVYLTSERPRSIGSACSNNYNDYKYGLNGTLPLYYSSGPSSSQIDSSAIISRYLSRTIFYLVGRHDEASGLDSCAPNAQGLAHLDKMYYWTQQIIPSLPGSTGEEGKLPSNNLIRFVEDTGHQDWKIITSDPGVETLMLKHWYANGTDAQAPTSNGVSAGDTPSKGTISKVGKSNDGVRASVGLHVTIALGVVASLATVL